MLIATESRAQLVLTIPPDPAPSSIGSNTTLHLLATGALPAGFNAGATDGTSTNVVVNVAGGETQGQFSARSGSTLNVSSGSMGIFVDLYNGSTTHFSGGTLGGFVNAFSGSAINISGGSMGDIFSAQSGSALRLLGGDFRVDGVSVNGLTNPGLSVPLDIPVHSVLSGTLSDGTPLAYTSQDLDFFANGTLTLEATALPAIGPTTITASTDLVPRGIRQGQTLQVDSGGAVGDHFGAGWGSTVHVNGGTVGINLEAVGSDVTISSGVVGDDMDANFGSVVSILGGSVGDDFDANQGSIVKLRGGHVGSDFDANRGSSVVFSGGSFGDRFGANSGSAVNLLGKAFFLDGVKISGLQFGVPHTIADRGAKLTGKLADDSSFALDLNATVVGGEDFFSADALLTVTRISPFTADFDNDGDVDGADRVQWELAFGAGDGADADGDGDSDANDFLIWQRQKGSSVSNLAALAVPEPSTFLLAASTWMIAALTQRKRRLGK